MKEILNLARDAIIELRRFNDNTKALISSNEKQTAELRIFNNSLPYIRQRLNDNESFRTLKKKENDIKRQFYASFDKQFQ